MITVKVMDISHYDKALALWKSTKGMGMKILDDSREGIYKFLLRNPSTSFAAFDGESLVGVILCGHDGRRGYIYHTAVLESRRGFGIGRLLLENAEKALINEGINAIGLVVYSDNDTGNGFWEKNGYFKRTDLIYRTKYLNKNNIEWRNT